MIFTLNSASSCGAIPELILDTGLHVDCMERFMGDKTKKKPDQICVLIKLFPSVAGEGFEPP